MKPHEFHMVSFDAARLAELGREVADAVGLPAGEVHIEVDERSPLGRTRLPGLAPVSVWVESGAFEDAKHPRHMSEKAVVDVLGLLLRRAGDRLDPGFGHPPEDGQLTLAQSVAWDSYCVGRCQRAGCQPSKPRRQYHFRNRHGFTDVADAVFERLWQAEGLTWADIEAACAETAAAARQPA